VLYTLNLLVVSYISCVCHINKGYLLTYRYLNTCSRFLVGFQVLFMTQSLTVYCYRPSTKTTCRPTGAVVGRYDNITILAGTHESHRSLLCWKMTAILVVWRCIHFGEVIGGVWTSLHGTHNVECRLHCKFSMLWSIKKCPCWLLA